VKEWLSRVVSNTVLRGEGRENRFSRWSTWFPAAPTVGADRFQGAGEPYPRHWRSVPESWPEVDLGDPRVHDALAEAIAGLPRPWRDVLIDRDVLGRDEAQVEDLRGITRPEQRAMLNRARAAVRRRLARRLTVRVDS
jgi:RNA polymerase sigma-70 factor, ECF subfamily